MDKKEVKVIGVDLAIKNCGLCLIYTDDSFEAHTWGMKDYTNNSVINFSLLLRSLVEDQKIYVDFDFNECSFPGRKKFAALKYFLAGMLLVSAKECNFVSGRELRSHYYCNSKMPKKDLHKLLIPEILIEQYNEHELDAYLLAKMYKG